MILKNTDMDTFAKEVCEHKKQVVVFGAGTILLGWISHVLNQYNITQNIRFVVDNDSAKWGKELTINDRNFVIVKCDEILDYVTGNMVVLITSSYFAAIVEQLDQKEQLADTECYIAPIMHITHQKKGESAIIDKSGEMQIPKVIHYCWFGRGQMPERNRQCIESWKKYCPDYEIVEWNEDNYDVYKNKYMGQAYDARKYGYVPDYARIDILYHHGGIYLDTDVELIKNWDDLLYLKAFTGFEEYPTINFGGGSGAVKGLPILKKILDFRENFAFIQEDGTYNLKTCGYYETVPLLAEGLEINGKRQQIQDLTVFPSECFHPKSSVTGLTEVTDNTYSIHQFNWSWVGEKQLEEKKRTHEEYHALLRRMQENG